MASVCHSVQPGRRSLPKTTILMVSEAIATRDTGVGTGVVSDSLVVTLTNIGAVREKGVGVNVGIGISVGVAVGVLVGVAVGLGVDVHVGADVGTGVKEGKGDGVVVEVGVGVKVEGNTGGRMVGASVGSVKAATRFPLNNAVLASPTMATNMRAGAAHLPYVIRSFPSPKKVTSLHTYSNPVPNIAQIEMRCVL